MHLASQQREQLETVNQPNRTQLYNNNNNNNKLNNLQMAICSKEKEWKIKNENFSLFIFHYLEL